MNRQSVDVVVIGAGAAGMAAATRMAGLGLRVVLLDEQGSPGGQIYRGITLAPLSRRDLLGPDYAHGNQLAQALASSSVRYEKGASVWQVTRDHQVSYLREGRLYTLDAKAVLLATGAMERPFPIAGWTLPGVMSAGAAQILLKSSGLAPSEPVVLAGCGPLLYLLGWQYLRAGVTIKALVDTTRPEDYWRARRHLFAALRAWPYLRKGLELMRSLRSAGIAHYTGAEHLAVEGEEAARALTFNVSGKAQRIASRCVLLHQGVVPNIQFSQALRARHEWDLDQLCFRPVTDAWGELDVPGIYVAGDGAGIGGAQAAAVQGQLAALGIAARLKSISSVERDDQARSLRVQLEANLRIRPFLDALYQPKEQNRIPADDVMVCRCEEVTAGELRSFVALGCAGPNQAKSFGRCGMGPCQGRMCGLTVTEVIAKARGVSAAEVGYYRIRPPIKPITLGELAGE
ncbi:NAD(P)/FAD-dependent oxidoreductase [Pseudomonas fluorescens]|uniref:Hydrogen cyanide synthase subunit HcnB n=1 Tax=Pseudomonas fluorescens TaxID=294 RepID=A0A5E6ZQ53_PSEFL|nr:NAD(P)/FAD-dependent oxidoreductase [Pseudomonas fluorescens]VVN66954.1 Hydrogen cyanide synthase subunit HcnB [Pseudomonas fluorescens]VVP73935.1 Hydrogen cyanide synthase subunit HcnB [Pseudomonas fluorescens]